MVSPLEILENRNGKLYIEGFSATKLAQEFDTPLYVMSETRIRENYRNIHRTLVRNYKKVRIYYSAKANSNISILRILKSEGAYIDVVSSGEVFLALKAGFSASRILFTGTSVRNDELRFLLNSNVMINIDSTSQLNRLLKLATPNFLSIRINPMIGAGHHDHCVTAGRDSKFGLWEDDAIRAYEVAKKAGVKRFGIHMHIGSCPPKIEPFILALDRLLEIAKKAHDEVKVDFELIDIGGGLSVPYRPEDEKLDLNLFSDKILSLFKQRIRECKLGEPIFCIEPGRYIVCDAGILLTTVNTVKITPFRKFVGVDAGFNTLIRPTMYGSYHPILVVDKLGLSEEETYDIVGPICESGDVLAKDRKLPKIAEGDVLAVLNAGAYGYSMSSQYNARPKAAEVLVKDGKYTLIKERENFDTLMRDQKVAAWLK